MSQDEYLPRLPDRWKLTKAIIDHIFLTVVGEAGQGIIEAVEEPLLKKRLNEDLKATFEHAERTFTEKYQGKYPELIEGLDSLGGVPLHTSPDLQSAVLTYYYNPASTDLHQFFIEYLESNYPSQPVGSFDEGVRDYISILERAIFDAVPAFRQSLGNLAALDQRDTLRQIQLILKDLSEYLKRAATSNEKGNSRHFYEQVRLPDGFVPRPELLDEIRSSVITPASALTSGIAGRTALHGMGGIGKTVMARALCDDPFVQHAFPDGILWATLGNEVKEADLIGKLRAWVLALGQSITDPTPSAAYLKNLLAQALEDKKCLLILDDVWTREDVEAFQVTSPNSCLLITTRNKAIAKGLRAQITPVPPMSYQQAKELLLSWAAGTLNEYDEPIISKIVEKLGRLPLALRLAGPQFEYTEPGEWLKDFDIRELEIDANVAESKAHANLLITFSKSLDLLKPAQRFLYTTLSIFREDEPIPESAIHKLWEGLKGLSLNQSKQLLRRFVSMALIETANGYSLHDLLREMTRNELAEEGIINAHNAILKAYTKTMSGGSWHTAPDDGYLYDHLAYHLLGAGRQQELSDLLTSSRDWMDEKYKVCIGDVSYTADLNAAIATFSDPLFAEQILLRFRLAAARQVIHARVAAYTDIDLQTLVHMDRKAEALAYARLRVDPEEQIKGLFTIHNMRDDLSDISLLSEAETISSRIYSNIGRVYSLRDIAIALSATGQNCEAVFAKALETARRIQDIESRTGALVAVADAMAASNQEAEPVLAEALEVTRKIVAVESRAKKLSDIAATMAKIGQDTGAVLAEMLEAVWSIKDAKSQAKMQGKIVSTLVAQMGEFAKALEVARRITDVHIRSKAFRDITIAMARAGEIIKAQKSIWTIEDAEHIPEAQREIAISLAQMDAIDRAQEFARSIEDTSYQADALINIASIMAANSQDAEAAFTEALEVTRKIVAVEIRDKKLRNIASHLVQIDAFSKAQEVAHEIEDTQDRVHALTNIITHFPQTGAVEEALELAHSIEDTRLQTTVLKSIARAIAASNQEAMAVFAEAQAVARGIEDARNQTEALRDIVSILLHVSAFTEAQEAARGIEDANNRTEALRDIVMALLQLRAFAEAQEVARWIEGARRVTALRDIAVAMVQAGAISEAQEVARGIEKVWARVGALRDIAIEMALAGAIASAQETLWEIDQVEHHASVLEDFAMVLVRTGALTEAQEMVWAIEDSYYREGALENIAKAMVHAGAFAMARETVHSIEHPWRRAYAQRGITAALTKEGAFTEAQDVALEIEKIWSRAYALKDISVALAASGQDKEMVIIATQTQESAITDTQEAARMIKDTRNRAEALGAISTAIAASGQNAKAAIAEALESVRLIEETGMHAYVQREIALGLAQIGSFAEAHKISQGIIHASGRVYTQRDITRIFTQMGAIAEALDLTQGIDNVKVRGDLQWAIAMTLVKSGAFIEAKDVAFGIEDAQNQARALKDIAKALAQTGAAVEAQEVAWEIDKRWAWYRADSFTAIAATLASSGQDAEAAFAEAQEAAFEIKDSRSRADALKDLASAHAQAGVNVKSQEIAQEIEDVEKRADTHVAISKILLHANAFTEAKEVAYRIEDAEKRDKILGTIVRTLANLGAFTEALDVAYWIENVQSRANAIQDIASVLAQMGNFHEALNLVRPKNNYALIRLIVQWADEIEEAIGDTSIFEILREVINILHWEQSSLKELESCLPI